MVKLGVRQQVSMFDTRLCVHRSKLLNTEVKAMECVTRSTLEYGNLNYFTNEQGHGTQWFVLDLACGHRVGRYTLPNNESAPKKAKCEYCGKNQKTIIKNYDYTSDKKGWCRNSDTGQPK